MTTEPTPDLRTAAQLILDHTEGQHGDPALVPWLLVRYLRAALAATPSEPDGAQEPKDYATLYLDGGGDPSFDQIDGFLYQHFNARAAYIREPDGAQGEGLPPTWCYDHKAYDHCEDAQLARLAAQDRARRPASVAPDSPDPLREALDKIEDMASDRDYDTATANAAARILRVAIEGVSRDH